MREIASYPKKRIYPDIDDSPTRVKVLCQQLLYQQLCNLAERSQKAHSVSNLTRLTASMLMVQSWMGSNRKSAQKKILCQQLQLLTEKMHRVHSLKGINQLNEWFLQTLVTLMRLEG